jgi:predicted transcriptional regulator
MRRNGTRQPDRDYYEIIKQILQNVYSMAEGCNKPFEIAYRCQLDLQLFLYYRNMLLSRNLLLISSNRNVHNQHYKITDKGIRYLQLFSAMEDDLKFSKKAGQNVYRVTHLHHHELLPSVQLGLLLAEDSRHGTLPSLLECCSCHFHFAL